MSDPHLELDIAPATDFAQLSHSLVNSEHKKGEKYVAFFLGEILFAIPSDSVAEVIQPLAVTPLPNMPQWLMGIADLRGEIAAVVSLNDLLKDPVVRSAAKTKFVVLKSEDAKAPISFVVDQLHEIVFLAEEVIEVNYGSSDDPIVGIADIGSKMFHLIDADKLVSLLNF